MMQPNDNDNNYQTSGIAELKMSGGRWDPTLPMAYITGILNNTLHRLEQH